MKNVGMVLWFLAVVLFLTAGTQAAVTVTTGPEANLNLLSGAPVYTGAYGTFTFAQATSGSLAQTFTMGEESIAVTSVNLTYENSATAAATLTMRIFEVADPFAGTISVPGTTLLTETFVAPNVGTTDTLLTITLGRPVVLKHNTSYAVFIDFADASAKSNFCWFRSTSDVYAAGAFYQDGAIKTGGARDGSLALTGEVAADGGAHTPNPSNGATVYSSEVAGLSDVSWFSPLQDRDGNPITEPNIVSVDGYDVWWSVGAEPNYVTDTPTYQAAPDQNYNPTIPITYDTTYYWRVDAHVTYDSNELTGTASLSGVVEGATWTFTTEPAYTSPVIETYDNIITTVGIGSGDLSATISGNSDAITSVTWTLLRDDLGFPAGSDAILTPTTIDNQSPTATLTTTMAGTYEVKLVISDGTTTLGDIAEVKVYADACQAQKDAGVWTVNPYDFDGNCLVDILDFAAIAAVWLDNTSMDTQAEAVGLAGYVPQAVFDIRIEAEWIDPNDPNACSNGPLGPDTNGVPDPLGTLTGIRAAANVNASGGWHLGNNGSGSWVDYMIDVPTSAVGVPVDVYVGYGLATTVLSQTISFGTGVEGEEALYGTGTVPSTGGWYTFVAQKACTVTFTTPGPQEVRVTMGVGGLNLDWFSFAW